MSIKAILFDLDGTLLPMDQELFAKTYIDGLVRVAAGDGYDPKRMADAIMRGIAAMVKNTGEVTNEEAFWRVLSENFGEKIREKADMFDSFYSGDFQKISEVCGFTPHAAEIISFASSRGFRVALATNPLFPRVATESRIRWAGLSPDGFELFTTYEGSHYSKPNPDYYREVLEKLSLTAEECLMVGNDVCEDMIAEELGMRVFLLTDCLINKSGTDPSRYPHGSFRDLQKFINELS